MRNYLKIILLISCLSVVACKKREQGPKTNDATVSINFDGNRELFFGKLVNKFQGVELERTPSVDRNNWYNYSLCAGKNERNYVIVLFNGPSPLTTENLARIEHAGIHYVLNGEEIFFQPQACVLLIENKKKNFISGSFHAMQGPLQDPFRRVMAGYFENVLQ